MKDLLVAKINTIDTISGYDEHSYQPSFTTPCKQLPCSIAAAK